MLDAHPLVLAEAACAAGFDSIGLRVSHDHALDASLLRRLCRRLDELDLRVHDVEVHRIGALGGAVEPLVDIAAELGAQFLLTVSDLRGDGALDATGHHLERIARMCSSSGLTAAIEYMAWTTPASSRDAARLAADVGAVVVVDVLHHTRVGEGPADLAALAASGVLGWLQLCDAPASAPADLLHEARHARLVPGAGELPLADLLAAVPDDTAIAVEVQSDVLAAASTPFERAAELFAAVEVVHPRNTTG
jgi:sugar phosphate isomerase/epimerase